MLKQQKCHRRIKARNRFEAPKRGSSWLVARRERVDVELADEPIWIIDSLRNEKERPEDSNQVRLEVAQNGSVLSRDRKQVEELDDDFGHAEKGKNALDEINHQIGVNGKFSDKLAIYWNNFVEELRNL